LVAATRSGAYRRLEAVLADDLDAEPEDETVTLKNRLLEELSHKSPVRDEHVQEGHGAMPL
jgi:hypothetical protein